jgi:hypothetical protein
VEVYDIAHLQGIPSNVNKVFDLTSVAHMLGVRGSTVSYALHGRRDLYTTFYIEKKSGGKRAIHAPAPIMRFLQGRILNTLLDKVPYPEHVAAYVKRRSTAYSAEKHVGKGTLIVVDLKDFFPSTRQAAIRHALQDYFHFNHYVANLIAALCTVPMQFGYGERNCVPQGGPTSGAICNLVAMHRLDGPVLAVCEEFGLTYTRYADDLAFSTEKVFSEARVRQFLKQLNKAVKSSGYRINYKKTRVARQCNQMRLLGTVVNEKVNVMRLQYKRLRARLHHCYYKGFDQVAKEMGVESGAKLESQIEGMIAYYTMINPQKANKLRIQLEKARKSNAEILHSL